MDGMTIGAANTTSASQSDAVAESLYTLLSPFNRRAVTLTPSTNIAEELEIDSVAIFDVIMDVEDRYDVTFPMEAIAEIKTIGELTETIRTLRC